MSGLATLVAANIRNSYRLKVAVFLMLGLSVLLIAGLIALVCVLVIVPQVRSPSPSTAEVARYLGLIVYGSGLLAMGMNLNVFTANNLVKEKTQRLFESILAGPVEARTLWLAKSLAVFIPGFVLCEGFAIASWLAVNALFLTPRIGFLAPASMIVNGLALVPILYFPLCCLVLLVGLSANPDLGQRDRERGAFGPRHSRDQPRRARGTGRRIVRVRPGAPGPGRWRGAARPRSPAPAHQREDRPLEQDVTP